MHAALQPQARREQEFEYQRLCNVKRTGKGSAKRRSAWSHLAIEGPPAHSPGGGLYDSRQFQLLCNAMRRKLDALTAFSNNSVQQMCAHWQGQQQHASTRSEYTERCPLQHRAMDTMHILLPVHMHSIVIATRPL